MQFNDIVLCISKVDLSYRCFHVLAVTELFAEQHLQLVQILIHLLPPANACLLKHLLGLLKRVCEQKETRMTPASLGRIFAPHLLIPRGVGFVLLPNSFLLQLMSFIVYNSPRVSI